MLSKLTISNYKLLSDVELDFRAGVPTVLIGPNASGKTTVLEILDFVSSIPKYREGGIFEGRGRFQEIVTGGIAKNIQISLTFSDLKGLPSSNFKEAFPLEESQLKYSFSISKIERYPSITQEGIILSTPTTSFSLLKRFRGEVTLWNDKSKSEDSLRVGDSEFALEHIRQDALYPILEYLRRLLKSIRVYPGFRVAPRWSRAEEERYNARSVQTIRFAEFLDPRGLNLTNVLYNLKTHHTDTIWPLFSRAVKAEFPFVRELFFPLASSGSVALAWKDRRYSDPTYFTAEQMSDGFLYYICLLTTLFTPTSDDVICFDEPGAHLHPSAIRRFVSILERKSEDSTVILTTHSNQILDYLSEPEHSIVVCLPTPNGASLKRMEPDVLKEWLDDYSLSELRSRGYLDPSNNALEDEL